MRILVLDTETTGLPASRIPADKFPNNWPHIVSFAWVIIENNLIVKQRNYLIKPIGWEIPASATKIHGITTGMAETGVDLDFVMTEFMEQQCDKMVAHNMYFDYNVLVNAIMWDLHRPFTGFNREILCSMTLSKVKCNIKGRFGLKPPKLSELYFAVFGRYPNEAKLHGALYDTLVLTECIQHSTWLQAALGLPVSNVYSSNEQASSNLG